MFKLIMLYLLIIDIHIYSKSVFALGMYTIDILNII